MEIIFTGNHVYKVEIFSTHNLVPNYYVYKIDIHFHPGYEFIGVSPINSIDPNNPSSPVLCTSLDIITQVNSNSSEPIQTVNLGIYFLPITDIDINLDVNLFEFPLDDGSLGIIEMGNYVVKSQLAPIKKEKKINYKDASTRSPTVFGWSCLIVFLFIAFFLMLLALFLAKCGK